MSGILPMKVIKVGNGAQSRIAQACDRCRSKKIRCDGVRPTCSQCANVGFECRTSDKLSRRAFPRGYTESLEERVRQLEAEVRELKDLLDGKDEKIDMLSAMHHNHRPSPALPDSPATPVNHQPFAREDLFRIQPPPLLLGALGSDPWLMGPSSGRSLITSLERKLHEAGRPRADFDPDAFLHVHGCPPLTAQEPDVSSGVPPRLFSDRCVNVFFQEWAPLFPVVHKPTFLALYEEAVASPEKASCGYELAQLHLVYSIAGLSCESPDYRQVAACERQWARALEALLYENSINTLQCLVLALLYYAIRGDYRRLQHYKSIAVGLSHRLGLHQSQKRFSLGALALETRKKVFWALYTIDCFSAAAMGLPKLFKEGAIETEYPSDTDDEYITNRGFQPTLPGESTRLSCALALFRASRILARVLESLYPTTMNHELSLQQLRTLEGELDAWYARLPSRLRLNFVQDKPSTDVTGSCSPFMALTFYYIRTLIYRPAVGSTLGPKAAPALLSVAESSKHMIQIMQLLEQRSMSFSFCLNKHDLAAVCGITLLYQVADLRQDGKLTREVGRLVSVVIKMLFGAKAPGCLDLERAARSLLCVDWGTSSLATPIRQGSMPTLLRQAPPPARAVGGNSGSAPGFFQHPFASGRPRLEAQEKGRRMTEPFVSAHEAVAARARARPSLDSIVPRDGTGMVSADSYHLSMAQGTVTSRSIPNLDYLSLNNTPAQTQPSSPSELARVQASGSIRPRPEQMAPGGGNGADKIPRVTTSDWEVLLGSMDGGLNNVYDAIYGGASLVNEASQPASHQPHASDWSPDSWDLSGFSLGEQGRSARGAAQSVPRTSDESPGSGEEVAPSELGLSAGSAGYHERFGRCGSGAMFGADARGKFPL